MQRIERFTKKQKQNEGKCSKSCAGLALKPLQELRNLLHEKGRKEEMPKNISVKSSLKTCLICSNAFVEPLSKEEGDPIYENLKKLLEVENKIAGRRSFDRPISPVKSNEAIINEAKKQLEADDDQIMDLEEEEKNMF